jgi:hypothetical protein
MIKRFADALDKRHSKIVVDSINVDQGMRKKLLMFVDRRFTHVVCVDLVLDKEFVKHLNKLRFIQ